MKRGDIYYVVLEPTAGHEQQGTRPVIVVSREEINRRYVPIVCPITSGGENPRNAGWTVTLHGFGLKTDGVVLCHQIRACDIKARNGRRIESTPPHLIAEVLSVLQDFFEI